jgi:hypothetical protein
MRRRRTTTRWCLPQVTAALVACSISTSPLLEVVHSTRVEHVACPHDGEFVDAPVGRPEIAHSDDRGSVLPGVDPTSGPEHRHDHCFLAPSARSAAGCGSSALFAGRTVVWASKPLTRSSDAPRAAHIALYLIAPKISPPSA